MHGSVYDFIYFTVYEELLNKSFSVGWSVILTFQPEIGTWIIVI